MGDIAISNGTCYTAAGERLGDEFIPCGNTAYGYQTCCGAGDNCLADLACFGIHGSNGEYGSFLTYFAGCTDPDYNDPSCPRKQVDQPWVALTLCDDAPVWAICSQPGNPSTLQPGATCSCTSQASATVAFTDARVLQNQVSLPQSAGETVSYFAGFTPTGTLTSPAETGTGGGGGGASASTGNGGSGTSATSAAGTRSPSSGSRASSAGASATGTAAGSAASGNASNGQAGADSGQSTSGSGLGTGAIVGIVIGAIAALLILAGLAFILSRRRRRQRKVAEEKKIRDSGLSTSPMKPGGLGEYVRPNTPPMAEVDSVPVAEVAGRPAQPWLFRNELDGKEIPSGKNSTVGSAKGTEPSVDGTDGRFELPERRFS